MQRSLVANPIRDSVSTSQISREISRCLKDIESSSLSACVLPKYILQSPSHLIHLRFRIKDVKSQVQFMTNPHRILRVVEATLARVRMDQDAQRAVVDCEPGDEGSELGGSEKIDFEHGLRVRANGFVVDGVEGQFGKFVLDELAYGVHGFDLVVVVL